MRAYVYETINSGGCGMITGMFEIKAIHEISDYFSCLLLGDPCISEKEYLKYKGDKNIYGLVIENPVKYEPIELSMTGIYYAPQSWRYIGSEGDILLSIHKKYAELIYSGKKTIEIRKTYPKEIF